jgi:hypothetical protein
MAVGLSTYAFWQHSNAAFCDLISAPEASHREEDA